MRKKTVALSVAAALLLGGTATACFEDDADVASKNISKAADNFEVQRRIVFFNGITDKYLLEIVGLCSIDTSDAKKLAVTCKVGKGEYKKHYLGLSDNVSYFVEQGASSNVSVNHYRVTFRPQSIIPDLDFRGSTDDLPRSQ